MQIYYRKNWVRQTVVKYNQIRLIEDFARPDYKQYNNYSEQDKDSMRTDADIKSNQNEKTLISQTDQVESLLTNIKSLLGDIKTALGTVNNNLTTIEGKQDTAKGVLDIIANNTQKQ